MTSSGIRDFYTQHSRFSALGKHAGALRHLPDDIKGMIGTIQGLVIYDAVAAEFYGCNLSGDRMHDIHLRSVEDILDRVLEINGRPLTDVRPPEHRIAGRCRNFVMLLIAALREKGIPARARCGFGVYFNPGSFEDHWVCEYWDAKTESWKLADPQFDAVWRHNLGISHDIADLPRGRMLVAGDAWQMCQSGKADPSTFGISFVGLRGLWMVAGNLVRDVAALNGMELQPWDVWGAMPRPDETLDDQQLAYFDRLAAFSREPDKHFEALRETYANDGRLTVPDQVFNALRNRPEALAA